LATARSFEAISPRSASVGLSHSHLSVIMSVSPFAGDDKTKPAQFGVTLADLGDLLEDIAIARADPNSTL
jgi:hypothetical protein